MDDAPEGWVTDSSPGLTLTQQLHALGNGVVPQQAVAALRALIVAGPKGPPPRALSCERGGTPATPSIANSRDDQQPLVLA